MTENTKTKAKKYFAAANTYRGFRSYFDSVFDLAHYERIYVLKGGPGTGKSSLMRRISTAFLEKSTYVEEIYCSSDPNSLDGVILESRGRKIAILDGTAPHERDAKIPGAKDEIINLADGLECRWLSAKKDEIMGLVAEKALAYKTAYNYLSIAGDSAEIIKECYRNNFDKFKAKAWAESIFSKISEKDEATVSTRLISSFGRYGERCLEADFEENSRVVRVGEDIYSTGLFLNLCRDILLYQGLSFIHFPTALDPMLTEAIYLPEGELVLTRGEREIDAEELTRLSQLECERIRVAKQLHVDALEEAKRWFAIASDLHFRLEKIYGEAMNFEANDRIYERLITEIANILEKDT